MWAVVDAPNGRDGGKCAAKFSDKRFVLGTFATRHLTLIFSKKMMLMKKVNWMRIAFVLLTFGMLVLESCRLFKPKCDCPKW
jgi:hypothetical protein